MARRAQKRKKGYSQQEVKVWTVEGGWPPLTEDAKVLRERIRGFLKALDGRAHLCVVNLIFGREYNEHMKKRDRRGLAKWLTTDETLCVVSVPSKQWKDQCETAVWGRTVGGPEEWRNYPPHVLCPEAKDQIMRTLRAYRTREEKTDAVIAEVDAEIAHALMRTSTR